MERRIAPERPERDARVLVNVAFADLDEAAELREAREPHRDRLGGERVENDVHAAPAGEFHDGFGEVAAPRVDHMLHAERLEQRAFGCVARRGDDFRAEVMRDLDRRHADAARARVDEDTFASAEVRHALERMPRSHEDHGQRRCFLERQFARNAADITAARQRLRCKAEHREAKHAITRCDVLHARTDGHDDTANLVAEDARIQCLAGIKRESLEHVAEVHARGFDVDQHFTRPAGAQRERREAQRVEVAALAGLEAQRHRRIERLLNGRTSSREALCVAGFATEGDFALGVVPQQFAPEQGGIGPGSHRRQIDPAAGEVRVFIKDDTEQPDAGSLSHRGRGHLAAHRLRPARDGIDPHFASGMGRRERLAEVQQRVGAHERIRDFRGCVEPPEVDDSIDRCRCRARCEKLRPILRRFRAQGESFGSGRGKLFAGPCDPAMGSGGAQLSRQLPAQPGGIGENEPRFFRGRFHRRGGGCRLLPGLSCEQSDLALTTRWSNQPRQRSRLAKTCLCQHSLPLRALQQRLMRTQRAVGEPPPTARETEDRLGPQLRRRRVHEDEAAARRQQIMQMAEGRADIAHRVQHIGPDDEVERSCGEILIGARFFEIENLALDFGECGQLLQRAGKEARRDVGERVGVQAALEQRQHVRRQASRAAADFEDAQSAAFREMARGFLHSRADRGQPVTRIEAVAVELLEQLRARAGKQHLHGLLFPAQDRAEFGAISRAKQSLGQMAGVLRDEGPQRFLCRIRRGGKGRSGAVTGGDFLEQTACRQTGDQTGKNRLHRRGDAQGIGSELPARGHTHFAQTMGEPGGGEVVAGGYRGLQFLTAADGDDLFQRCRGGGLQLFDWHRRA